MAYSTVNRYYEQIGYFHANFVIEFNRGAVFCMKMAYSIVKCEQGHSTKNRLVSCKFCDEIQQGSSILYENSLLYCEQGQPLQKIENRLFSCKFCDKIFSKSFDYWRYSRK